MKNGAYDLEGIIWHQHSPQLMEKILKMWRDKDRPIVDLGCGLNYYVTVLVIAGYKAIGLDAVDLGNKFFRTADLTEPCYFTEGGLVQRRNVLSLEVGEHIPAEKAAAYLDNVCAFGGDVILSWAVPGQAGVGHINCQSNTWVEVEMEKRGYKLNIHKSAELRMSVHGSHCGWFVDTLMYYEAGR